MKTSPPLSDYFKKKPAGGGTPDTESPPQDSSNPEEGNQPPPQANDPGVGTSGPTPRRLHFSTQLDESQEASEDDAGGHMIVDYF